jgi:hypothetical protein
MHFLFPLALRDAPFLIIAIYLVILSVLIEEYIFEALISAPSPQFLC